MCCPWPGCLASCSLVTCCGPHLPLCWQVPEPLRACQTADEYMKRLPEFDGEMSAKLEEAKASGEVLRYVGVVDVKAGRGSVELRRSVRLLTGRQAGGWGGACGL